MKVLAVHPLTMAKRLVFAPGADSYYGQLGNNTNTDSNVPVAVSGLSGNVFRIAAGTWHSLATRFMLL